MDNIRQNMVKKPKKQNIVLESINKLKTIEQQREESYKNAKVVDIESSTIFANDYSFLEQYDKQMQYLDNLNEDEIKDPIEEKQNYYSSDYWASNGIVHTIGDIDYFYNYDNKNNEIILKYYRKNGEDNIKYVEDMYEVDKENVKQHLFFGDKAEIQTGKFLILKTEEDFQKFLNDVNGDVSNFIYKDQEYSIMLDVDMYVLNFKSDLITVKNSSDVYLYLKENTDLINGYTYKDTIDFLNSHPEFEHIYMDIKDKGYTELSELTELELCNLADTYGIHDGEDYNTEIIGDGLNISSYFNPGDEICFLNRPGEIKCINKDTVDVYFYDVNELEEIDGKQLLEQEGYLKFEGDIVDTSIKNISVEDITKELYYEAQNYDIIGYYDSKVNKTYLEKHENDVEKIECLFKENSFFIQNKEIKIYYIIDPLNKQLILSEIGDDSFIEYDLNNLEDDLIGISVESVKELILNDIKNLVSRNELISKISNKYGLENDSKIDELRKIMYEYNISQD